MTDLITCDKCKYNKRYCNQERMRDLKDGSRCPCLSCFLYPICSDKTKKECSDKEKHIKRYYTLQGTIEWALEKNADGLMEYRYRRNG